MLRQNSKPDPQNWSLAGFHDIVPKHIADRAMKKMLDRIMNPPMMIDCKGFQSLEFGVYPKPQPKAPLYFDYATFEAKIFNAFRVPRTFLEMQPANSKGEGCVT